MSVYAKRVAIGVAFVLACATFTGVAFAGDGNGNGDNAPGQERKIEESQQPAAPPGQAKKQEEQAPAAPAVHSEADQPSSPGKSGEARGQAKEAEKAAAEHAAKISRSKGAGKQADKRAGPRTVRAQSESQGNSRIAHQHVIICHRTGSDTNPYVVINISRSALERAHKASGHPTLNGRDDIVLAGPSLAVRPGSKGGFDKSDFPAPVVHPAPPVTREVVTHAVTHQPTVTVTSTVAVQPIAGVAGGEVAIAQPKAHERGRAGGVLGALARVGRGGELPFTGVPLWVAALAAFALLGGGFAVRRATR